MSSQLLVQIKGLLALGSTTYIQELTWCSPLSLRDGSLVEEEEDWLPSPNRELPEPADGPDKGCLSPDG